ncbi:type I polyketide synthase [Kitasatospora sp. NPDC003701]
MTTVPATTPPATTPPAAWDEPIAVIGLSCRLPGGANDPAGFWELLARAGDAVVPVPAGRWAPDAGLAEAKRRAGLLDAVDEYDAAFMGLSPREAALVDPQQRLALELAWEALEDAALAPGGLAGTRAGVFVGAVAPDRKEADAAATDPAATDPYAVTGGLTALTAGRVAHLLGLAGPALVVDTASSSSLVAVHLACQSLRLGESAVALAGGVNVLSSGATTAAMDRLGTLSPNGRCRAFDESADGYVRGEGGGFVVLKRLGDARRDGDPVRALIRGGAVNHDGSATGLTAPDPAAQRSLVQDALAAARLRAGELDHIEAHGTGTPVGDLAELTALSAVVADRPAGAGPLVLGSVKTNIGHLEAAAGIAGLIKVVLSLEHERIPRHLHLASAHPALAAAAGRLALPTEERAWPRGERVRRAGVSSFGLAGTNAHLIVEEAPPPAPTPGPGAGTHLLPLSARSPQALAELAGRLARRLAAAPEPALADVCRTAGEGRTHFAHRAAVLADSPEDARFRLRALAAGRAVDDLPGSAPQPGAPPRVAVLFGGQGSQYAGMGRGLYLTEPVFRAAVDECDELLGPLPGGRRLRSVLHPGPAETDVLDRTEAAQPALFAVEWALWRLWHSWGLRPDVLLGHGVGELAAACASGAMTPGEGILLAAERGRLMQALPPGGAMLSVRGEPAQVAAAGAAASAGAVAVAAHHHAGEVVLSGPRDEVERLARTLSGRGLDCTALPVPHAFHSALMEPALDAIEQAAAAIAPGVPRTTMVSTLTGEVVTAPLDAAYWRRQAREPVRFAAALGTVERLEATVLLEAGPHPVLLDLAARAADRPERLLRLPSLRRGASDRATALRALGGLYAAGAEIDWARVGAAHGVRRGGLPGYPFRRRRPGSAAPADPAAPVEPVATAPTAAARPIAAEPAGPAAPVATEPPGPEHPLPDPEHPLLGLVRSEVAAMLGHARPEAIDPGLTFKELGVDSLIAVELSHRLSTALGRPLPATLVYDHPVPTALAQWLHTEPGSPDGTGLPGPEPQADVAPPAGVAPPEVGSHILDVLRAADADAVFAFIDHEFGPSAG